MKTTISDSMVPFKLNDLVEMIMSRKGMDMESAISYLYFSKLYSDLINDNLKLWYQSSESLYFMLEIEKNRNKYTGTLGNKESLFCVFCIENYIKYKMPNQKEKVIELFSKFGVYHFLISNFEMLHSQDVQYIMDTIHNFLINRGA